MTIRFGSVCSGIEAASVAWGPMGWRADWFSEIDKPASSLLAHHYPHVANLGDMRFLAGKILSGQVTAPDVFCGGTPCQAFSLAGLRGSLQDSRGNLSLTFCEIANAIDAVRSIFNAPASVVFWENVVGVLHTKDNAFGHFLAGLAGENSALQPPGGKWANAGAVLGPKRRIAWRVLDSQYFGLPQQRKRVFVVASARDGFDPAEILFERALPDGIVASGIAKQQKNPCGNDGGAIEPAVTYGFQSNAGQALNFKKNKVGTLLAGKTGGGCIFAVGPEPLRKLTPLEYERCQGFPDNYTKVPGLTDTTRYQALGNSWSIPPVRWIGERMAQIGGLA